MPERIEPTCIEDVRPDHLGRYLFAAKVFKKRGIDGSLLDMGCGVGYGSSILAESFEAVHAVELSPDAEAHYRRHFARDNICFDRANAFEVPLADHYDGAVCFEFLEHVHEADKIVGRIAAVSDILICSTPNELVRPHAQLPVNPAHVRHYTPDEWDALLLGSGFTEVERFSQAKSSSVEVLPGSTGKFLVAVATR